MSDYLTAKQIDQLLGGINPNRVGKDGKGFSHVEAYEIRAHLIRVFGFGRWSADLIDQRCIFDTEGIGQKKKDGKPVGDPYPVWSVCYLATVRLTVCAPDGTVLATYTEAATGEAQNQPHRGDAHDLAVKTAESQAFKRCAMNLGDAYGLSLYRKGSLNPLVRDTLVRPAAAGASAQPAQPVDAHITEPLPAESEQVEDKRETNPPKPAPQPRTIEASEDDEVTRIQTAALNPPADAAAPYFARLQMEATKAGVMKKLTDDGQGNVVTVGALIQSAQRRRPAA